MNDANHEQFNSALKAMGDDASLLSLVANQFLASVDGHRTRLAQLCEAKDFESLAREGHGLKGSIGALCSSDIKEAAHALELAAQSNAAEDVQNSLGSLEEALDALERDLPLFIASLD
ncbi:MAG: Hpt domain-containing protein [Myxococcota bacterium]